MTLTQIKPAGLSKPVDLADNEKIRLGTGNDLEIYHDGTNSFITNTTGSLKVREDNIDFQNSAGTENLAKFIANGAVNLYYDNSKKFETTSGGVTITGNLIATGNLNVNDNGNINVGNSGDLQLFHNGTNSFIDSDTGNLVISSVADLRFNSADYKFMNTADNETLARFIQNGAVELYYDNSKKLETTANGADLFNRFRILGGTAPSLQLNRDSTGNSTATRAMLGLSTGSNNFINGSTTDDVILNTPHRFIIGHATNEIMAVFDPDGEVQLRHDNSTKFQTTSTGVQITGDVSLRDGYAANANGGTGIAAKDHSGAADDGLGLYGTDGVSIHTANAGTVYERMRINTSGEVGIGQSSPVRRLHVKKGSNTTDGAFRVESATGNIMDMGTDATGHFINCVNADPFRVKFAGSEKIRFPSDGGITFNGDTAAANALDDYEEGTWTPTLRGDTGDPTINYTVRRGYYSKVGSLVHVWFDIAWNSKSGGSGNVIVNPLPYDSGSSYYHGFGVLAHGSGFTEAAGTRGIYVNANANFFYFVRTNSNASVVQTGNIGNTGHLIGGLTYRTGSI